MQFPLTGHETTERFTPRATGMALDQAPAVPATGAPVVAVAADVLVVDVDDGVPPPEHAATPSASGPTAPRSRRRFMREQAAVRPRHPPRSRGGATTCRARSAS